MCGVSATFGIRSSGLSIVGGSNSITSSPAPAMPTPGNRVIAELAAQNQLLARQKALIGHAKTPTPDCGTTAELMAQHSQLLAAQNDMLGQLNQLLTLLKQQVAAVPATATPATAADTPAAEAPAAEAPPATTVNWYGRESLTHVTGDRILAILDEALRTAEVAASTGWGGPPAAWDITAVAAKADLILQEAVRTFSIEMAVCAASRHWSLQNKMITAKEAASQ